MGISIERKPNVIFNPEALEAVLKEKAKLAAHDTHLNPKKEEVKFDDRIDKIAVEKIKKIADIQTALNEVESFAQLRFIGKKATAELSHLGKRYVKVRGFEGTLSIDALAKKVVDLVKKNPDFDDAERRYGKDIINFVEDLYFVCRIKVINSKGLTKILTKLREIPYLILSCFNRSYSKTQWNWRYCELKTVTTCPDKRGNYRIFELYTRNQYKKTFHKDPIGNPTKLHGLNNLYFKKPVEV